MRWFFLVAALLVSCGKDTDDPSKAKAKEGQLQLVGIWPKDWSCDQIGTAAEIGQVLGGQARLIDGALSTLEGVAKPCNYMVTTAAGDEPWTFDIDCRPSYKENADKIMAQWTEVSSDNVQRYNVESDAAPTEPPPKPPKPTAGSDAPPDARPARAPQEAHEVAVGRKGVDVLGDGIIFVDDDAPCYVRVVGADTARRLAFAQYVAQKLIPATAPMTPRAAE